MTCDVCQRKLLALGSPDRVSDDLLGHLAACPACRQVQKRLVEIDRQVAAIPVPPAPAAMHAVIHRVLTDPTLRASVRGRQPAVVRRWPKALAAAMVVLAVGGTLVAVWRSGQPVVAKKAPAADPLLAKVVERNIKVATAKSPQERVAAYADLADDIQQKAQVVGKVAEKDDLAALAKLYARVVQDGIVAKAAKDLAPEDRQRVLKPIALQLAQAGADAERLANDSPASSQPALRDLAKAAKDANQQLLQIMHMQNG